MDPSCIFEHFIYDRGRITDQWRKKNKLTGDAKKWFFIWKSESFLHILYKVPGYSIFLCKKTSKSVIENKSFLHEKKDDNSIILKCIALPEKIPLDRVKAKFEAGRICFKCV